MSSRILVVGLGGVGLRAAWELHRRGYKVLGVDASGERVKLARSLGINAFTGDAARLPLAQSSVEPGDTVVVALPSDVSSRIALRLYEKGFRVVDASVPSPKATPSGRGGVLLAEAGLSPGYSTLILSLLESRGRAEELSARVYVGSVSENPTVPLGYAASWSVEDFLSEYVNPVTVKISGRVVKVDPLDERYWGEIDVPGLGVLECFPSRGLAGFLERRGNLYRELIECSVRRPGHLKVMRSLKDLGILDDAVVSSGGCPVRPRELLGNLLRKKFSGVRDVAVLRVEVDGFAPYNLVVNSIGGWSATSIAVGGFVASAAELVAEEDWLTGVVYPEDLPTLGLHKKMLDLLSSRGLGLHKG